MLKMPRYIFPWPIQIWPKFDTKKIKSSKNDMDLACNMKHGHRNVRWYDNRTKVQMPKNLITLIFIKM